MADGWRVCLVFDDHTGTGTELDSYRAAVRGLLRDRFGDDVAVSGEKKQVFLYASTAEDAETAEHMARELLAQLSLMADLRTERWDPSAQAWHDARTGAADPAVTMAAAPEGQRPRRIAHAIGGGPLGKLISDIIETGPF